MKHPLKFAVEILDMDGIYIMICHNLDPKGKDNGGNSYIKGGMAICLNQGYIAPCNSSQTAVSVIHCLNTRLCVCRVQVRRAKTQSFLELIAMLLVQAQKD